MKSPLHFLARFIIGIYFLIMFSPSAALATPDYARQTGLECGQCHIDAIGGGPLTQAGKTFLADLKLKGLYRPLTTGRQVVRLVI